MQLIAASQRFSFNYTAYDQASSLYVGFSIYDVSSGTPVFLTKVAGSFVALGAYMGSYTPALGKTYLVIGVVYTSNTYLTVDTTRPATADLFQVPAAAVTYLPFAYSAFDQSNDLFLQASVYDLATGTPAFMDTINMSYVTAGVYFGAFNGIQGSTYNVVQNVFTDNTYDTLNLNYSPGCDEFDCIPFTGGLVITNVLTNATLIGQSLSAVLEET